MRRVMKKVLERKTVAVEFFLATCRTEFLRDRRTACNTRCRLLLVLLSRPSWTTVPIPQPLAGNKVGRVYPRGPMVRIRYFSVTQSIFAVILLLSATVAAARKIACAESSMSFSVVDQFETETRMAAMLCQVVPPSQQVPSCCTR